MPTPEPQYDIAFSLTSKDTRFVQSLVKALPRFKCFFYQEKDRELTGSSAFGPMRLAFRYGSKLQVIVHRSPWGKAGYTKLEDEAISDRYFQIENAPPPFLIRMDLDYPKPDWFSDRNVWCNRKLFTIKQIADQIGEKFETRLALPPSPSESYLHSHLIIATQVHSVRTDVENEVAKRVEIRQRNESRDHLLKTSDGFDLLLGYMEEFREHIEKYTKEFEKADPVFHVNHGKMGPAPYWYVMSSASRSVRIKWERNGGPSIRDDKLIVEYCKDPATVPGKTRIVGYWHGQGNDPRLLHRDTYHATINFAEAFVWTQRVESIDWELHLAEYPFDPEELAYRIVDVFHQQHQRESK